MTDSHTIGPWKACASVEGDFLGIYPDTGRAEFPIAKMPDFVLPDVNLANAHLMAASPELYAALHAVNKLISEAAMTGFNCHDGDWAQRLYDSQRDTSRALAKARGQQ